MESLIAENCGDFITFLFENFDERFFPSNPMRIFISISPFSPYVKENMYSCREAELQHLKSFTNVSLLGNKESKIGHVRRCVGKCYFWCSKRNPISVFKQQVCSIESTIDGFGIIQWISYLMVFPVACYQMHQPHTWVSSACQYR